MFIHLSIHPSPPLTTSLRAKIQRKRQEEPSATLCAYLSLKFMPTLFCPPKRLVAPTSNRKQRRPLRRSTACFFSEFRSHVKYSATFYALSNGYFRTVSQQYPFSFPVFLWRRNLHTERDQRVHQLHPIPKKERRRSLKIPPLRPVQKVKFWRSHSWRERSRKCNIPVNIVQVVCHNRFVVKVLVELLQMTVSSTSIV